MAGCGVGSAASRLELSLRLELIQKSKPIFNI